MAAPPQYQSLESIRQAAENHAVGNMGDRNGNTIAEAGRLDSRLRLQQCSETLETYTPPGKNSGARQTVGVRCNGSKPWSLFVPVTISIFEPVVVNTKPLSKGDTLGPGDLTVSDQNVASLRQAYFSDIQPLLGKKLKRNVQPNTVLTNRLFVKELAIKRGQKVVILAKSNIIQIHTEGKALEDGTIGKRIRVVNQSSGKEIEAKVIKPGFVEVSF